MNAKMLLALAVVVLAVSTSHSCPPVLETDFTVRGPGGSYGYMHLSYNNLLWRPGQPRRYHDRFLLLGPVSVRLTSPILFGSIAFASAVALFGAACRWNNQRKH